MLIKASLNEPDAKVPQLFDFTKNYPLINFAVYVIYMSPVTREYDRSYFFSTEIVPSFI